MQWINTILQGILLGGLYALYGTGLSLIFGVMRIVNLAHGDFIVLGAFLSLVVTQIIGLPPLVSLVIVVPVMFVMGYVLQKQVLNTTIGAGLMPPLVITFGLSVIVQNVLQLWFSADSQGLDAGALETASIRLNEQLAVGIMPLITFMVTVLVLLALQRKQTYY